MWDYKRWSRSGFSCVRVQLNLKPVSVRTWVTSRYFPHHPSHFLMSRNISKLLTLSVLLARGKIWWPDFGLLISSAQQHVREDQQNSTLASIHLEKSPVTLNSCRGLTLRVKNFRAFWNHSFYYILMRAARLCLVGSNAHTQKNERWTSD